MCYTTDNKAMPYIQCGNLSSTGKDTECYAQLQPWRYKTADEAAEAWNRRDILGGHEPDDFCSKIERRESDENN